MPGPVWLPEVVGDPAGMRALASTLRSTARTVAATGSACSAAVVSMTFEGPAGDRFRDRIERVEGSTRSTAEELDGLAGRIERAAAEVEAQQRERERRLEELRRELEADRARVRAAS